MFYFGGESTAPFCTPIDIQDKMYVLRILNRAKIFPSLQRIKRLLTYEEALKEEDAREEIESSPIKSTEGNLTALRLQSSHQYGG